MERLFEIFSEVGGPGLDVASWGAQVKSPGISLERWMKKPRNGGPNPNGHEAMIEANLCKATANHLAIGQKKNTGKKPCGTDYGGWEDVLELIQPGGFNKRGRPQFLRIGRGCPLCGGYTPCEQLQGYRGRQERRPSRQEESFEWPCCPKKCYRGPKTNISKQM